MAKCPNCGARIRPDENGMPIGEDGSSHYPNGNPCLERQLLQLQAENADLHLTLFHVENGLSHPDERIRKLIEAAKLAREVRDGPKD